MQSDNSPQTDGAQDVGVDFDWDDMQDDGNVVQQAVNKVAIYRNMYGDVAIRRSAEWDEDREPFIVIGHNNALNAARAILRAAGLDEDFEIVTKKAGRQRKLGNDTDAPETAQLTLIAAE